MRRLWPGRADTSRIAFWAHWQHPRELSRWRPGRSSSPVAFRVEPTACAGTGLLSAERPTAAVPARSARFTATSGLEEWPWVDGSGIVVSENALSSLEVRHSRQQGVCRERALAADPHGVAQATLTFRQFFPPLGDAAIPCWTAPFRVGGLAKIDKTFAYKLCYPVAMQTKTRNVSLTPEIDAFIADRIASGRFRSASEVVRAALRLLEANERQQGTPERRHRAKGRQAGR